MRFPKPEFICSPRLVLHPVENRDFDRLAALLTDKQVAKTYMLPDFTSQEQVRQMFDRLADLSRDENRFVYGIYFENELIGFMNDVEIRDNTVEIGYAILPDYHNQGFATEALSAALEALFTMGFDAVRTGAFPHNSPSIRVMQKAGMTPIDYTEDVEYRGEVYTCVFYEKRC